MPNKFVTCKHLRCSAVKKPETFNTKLKKRAKQ